MINYDGMTQEELALLASGHWEMRATATRMLTDQTALAKLAVNDKHWSVRHEATKKLTNKKLLAEFEFVDIDEDVRNAAAWKLAEPR